MSCPEEPAPGSSEGSAGRWAQPSVWEIAAGLSAETSALLDPSGAGVRGHPLGIMFMHPNPSINSLSVTSYPEFVSDEVLFQWRCLRALDAEVPPTENLVTQVGTEAISCEPRVFVADHCPEYEKNMIWGKKKKFFNAFVSRETLHLLAKLLLSPRNLLFAHQTFLRNFTKCCVHL